MDIFSHVWSVAARCGHSWPTSRAHLSAHWMESDAEGSCPVVALAFGDSIYSILRTSWRPAAATVVYLSGMDQAPMIGIQEFARILGFSARTFRRRRAEGAILPPHLNHGHPRWSLTQILRWINEGCPPPPRHGRRASKPVAAEHGSSKPEIVRAEQRSPARR